MKSIRVVGEGLGLVGRWVVGSVGLWVGWKFFALVRCRWFPGGRSLRHLAVLFDVGKP